MEIGDWGLGPIPTFICLIIFHKFLLIKRKKKTYVLFKINLI